MVKLGQNVIVGNNVEFRGNDISVGNNCILDNCVIENDVSIDSNTIIGKTVSRGKNSTLKDLETKQTHIKSGTKIGVNAVIYSNVEINENCFIADFAEIRENVALGKNVIVGRNTLIENNCVIGDNSKLQSHVYITSDSQIGSGCFFGPCAVTSNDKFMGRTEKRFALRKGVIAKDNCRIGAGVVILPGVIIEEETVIGAGSVVTKSTLSKKVYVGNPAKIIKDVPIDELRRD